MLLDDGKRFHCSRASTAKIQELISKDWTKQTDEKKRIGYYTVFLKHTQYNDLIRC